MSTSWEDALVSSGDLDPYVQQLLDAVTIGIPLWLTRCVVSTSTRLTGGCPQALRDSAVGMAHRHAAVVVGEIERLLAADVDQQRTNPLSIVRNAVRYPTALLIEAGLAPVSRDPFAVRAFPDDIFNLSPATWADIDESLQEPGLIWGAWKAKTVLDRRRNQS